MTKKQAEKKYKEYLEGHIGNVSKALELLYSLEIPYVVKNIDKLRSIVKEHDKSKYDEPEWSAYLHHFYPTKKEEEMMGEEFDVAVKHHIKNNKHHWDFWCDEKGKLQKNIDREDYKLYCIERICDWLSMAGQNDESPDGYYNANKDFIKQPKYARKMCDEIFAIIPKDYAKDMWKGNRGKLDEDIYLNRKVVDKLGKRVKKSKTSNTIEIDTQMTNHDKQLKEMKLSQIKNDSKRQDPERISRSKNVKSTYLGMSKFGILNFKTTSESRNGYHYQTIEFKDLRPFEDIIKSGKDITPQDVKKQLQDQDMNIWCTDESFSYWAWGHKAYKHDFLYIDERIPDLKKRIQAPTVNNVDLNGGSCKHILSVIDYVTKPFVLLAIADDINEYLKGNEEVSPKYKKQDVAVQNQYDQVAEWDWSDIEDYTGLSKAQILRDLSKTIQVVPSIDKGDVLTDLVGEALPQESQGLKREIVNRAEELLAQDK
ncbi:MAG: hypothetical protein J6T15_04995 [Bacilli bacterium]|nr:hypothetical protein [Bacilli bacterium]